MQYGLDNVCFAFAQTIGAYEHGGDLRWTGLLDHDGYFVAGVAVAFESRGVHEQPFSGFHPDARSR